MTDATTPAETETETLKENEFVLSLNLYFSTTPSRDGLSHKVTFEDVSLEGTGVTKEGATEVLHNAGFANPNGTKLERIVASVCGLLLVDEDEEEENKEETTNHG